MLLAPLWELLLTTGTVHAFTFAYSSNGSIQGAHLRDMEEIVALFKKENPDCEITLRNSTERQDNALVDEFIAANSLNEPADVPDVAVLYRTTWPRLMTGNRLHPLSDFIPAGELERLRASIRPELFADYYGRNTPAAKYALPLERSFPMLLVNLTALPEFKGRETVTWDELFKSLKREATFTLPIDHWTATYVLSNTIGKPIVTGTAATLAERNQVELVSRLAALKKRGVLVTVPMHHDAVVSFANGETAAILVTTSSYQTAAKLAHFPFAAMMPPFLSVHRLHTGGADLVIPARTKVDLSPKIRHDIKTFLTWLLTPRINALWAVKSGYLPVVKLALQDPLYKAELESMGPTNSAVPLNRAHWATYPFHKLEEFCNFDPLSSLISAIFTTAIDTPNSSSIRTELLKGEEALTKLLAKPCSR